MGPSSEGPNRFHNVNVVESLDGVKKKHIEIPVRDGVKIPAVLYQPESTQETGTPLIVFYHGGGWCLGIPQQEEVNCVNAVHRFGAVCVSVGYRLAPEFPFPTPVNDCWDALQWLAANAGQVAADPTRGFLIYGESAGANLAIVCTLLARDEKLSPPITGLSASIPAVLSPDAVPEKYQARYTSHVQNEFAPGLDEKALKYVIGNYQPDKSSPLFNCFNWPTGHSGLPPVHIHVCGLDPLRDEGLLYEEALRTEYGVRTRLTVYPGLPHAFWSLFPMLKSARKVVENTMAGFEWLLGNGPSTTSSQSG
ncbi:Alpha/Beta hydrolase protein [Pestalotiopsis sp. NC0098]|nr:Alpha/Beta hydrolase protein [Pestalotiopsis sp. NC0098]